MKCPYCSKEMSIGYIYDPSNPIQWFSEGKKPPFIAVSFTASKDAVKLNSKFKGGRYRAESFYCDTCHIVIAKTEE